MDDLNKFHSHCCPSSDPSKPTKLQLSLDGVQDCKSSGVSVDMYSVNYDQCRNVYPVRCIRPINRYRYNEQASIKSVLEDLKSSNCHVTDGIFDNPKRSIARHV